MPRRRTARELEAVAARRQPRRLAGDRRAGREPSAAAPAPAEPLGMLRRRGLDPRPTPRDVPLPPGAGAALEDALLARLGHYAFRLFLRGAILRPDGFAAGEPTRYVSAAQGRAMAEDLVALGLAEGRPRGRFRLVHPARSFGGTLEWWLARELERRLGFAVAHGVRSGAPGVGGDLDVVAAADGRLVYVEAKSSPPKHVAPAEVRAFVRRVRAVRPDVALFVVDTALRLSDKIVPMLAAAVAAEGGRAPAPRRVFRETFALGPHLYAVNAREDLVDNVCRAIAEGLRALAPQFP